MSAVFPWEVVPLQNIAEQIDYGLTASATDSANGPKFLRITDIQEDRVDWSTVPFCNCTVEDSKKYALMEGDIVFARTGATTGKSFLVRSCPLGSVFASYLIRVRPSTKVVPGYLARFFQTPNYWNQITRSSTGTAQAGVNASNLKKLAVPLPPLEEQHRIAEILDRAEELRSKRREAIAQLDTLTQAIFLEMFGNPVTNQKGWDITKVREVADVQGGLQVSSARKKYPCEVPYLRVANVYRGYLDLSEIKMIRATDTEISRTLLNKNDLLIVEGHGNPNEIGRVALWDGSITGCIHQNHIIRARFDTNKIVPLYACHYLNSPGGRQHLLKSGKTTSGLNTISVSEVRSSPVSLPPLQLQSEFAHQAELIEKLKASHRASLSELDALFASLQHRAFRGEL